MLDNYYPIRVWVTTLLIGSSTYWLFLYLANRITGTSIYGLIGDILLTVVYTGLCSLPAMFSFLLIYHTLNFRAVNKALAKIILLFVGIFGCTFTLMVMPIVGGDIFSTAQIVKLGFFCFPLIFSTLFFRFLKK